MLELLQNPSFREAISNQQCAKFIEDQILLHWQYYNRKRGKIEKSANEEKQQESNVKNSERPESRTGKSSGTAHNNNITNNSSSSSKLTTGAVPLKKQNIASSGAANHNINSQAAK
jgi:hypothetical protein